MRASIKIRLMSETDNRVITNIRKITIYEHNGTSSIVLHFHSGQSEWIALRDVAELSTCYE